MKNKIIISLIIVISLFAVVITCFKINNKDNDNNLTKVKLAEVTHSAFYAPLYVALEKGYFKEEGLEIELILTPGADKVAASVLSNDVHIGFAGAEAAVYVYDNEESDYLQLFNGLTKRDGQFIVGRNKNENFTLKDLIGKEVLVGRKGGMPALNFLKALENEGIKSNEVKINYSIDFAGLTGAFIGGTGDFVNLFEPNATKLEKEGYGYTVASIGAYSDEVPYTAFFARKSYINNNDKVIESFTKAIEKGLEFVHNNDAKTIANAILKQFSDTSLNDLTVIVNRYKEADSWLPNTFIDETSFKNLQDILVKNKLTTNYVPYKELIKNVSKQ